MHIKRYLETAIKDWLPDRMVFVGGPRQVGKTYLAKQFLKSKENYLSWDDLSDRALLKKHALPLSGEPMVIDEIHKYSRWRTLLKGFYDKNKGHSQIIVTGSARLDHFRRGGDSLFGRYHYLRLHPLTLAEIDPTEHQSGIESLLEFGGFPEPFVKQSKRFLKVWQRERTAKVIYQDLRDLTLLKDYTELELLADLLPSRVGSLLSLNSIAEDLEKSPHTIKQWIQILSSVYQCFTIDPFGAPKIKANKKQKKLYLWDWSSIEDPAARFENFVASHLLKYCHFIEDTEGDRMELRFLRDSMGREVDFVVLKNSKPLFAVECKSGEKKPSPHIEYFRTRTNIPTFYQIYRGTSSYVSGNTQVLPFEAFARTVGLV